MFPYDWHQAKAAQERREETIKRARPANGPIFGTRIRTWLGEQLVIWGLRLQGRLDTAADSVSTFHSDRLVTPPNHSPCP